MKQLVQLNLTLITIFMTACSGSIAAPSSHKSDKEDRFIQRHLDKWLNEEWEPAVKEKDKETKEHFKLQDYVDKMSLYIEAHPGDMNNSHVRKLESMPVIGN